jgi:predicted CoA-binding protein
LLEVKGTKLTITNAKGEEIDGAIFDEPVREVFSKEIVEVFSKESAVAEIARKHPKTADQVEPLKAWLQEQVKEK